MLPQAFRMRRSTEFSAVVRSGSRVRHGCLVVHQLIRPAESTAVREPRVGLVVGKAVGPSVVRHRVSRRLRALLAARLDRLPPASSTVVRALAGAGEADSAALAADLDAALARLSRRSDPAGVR